MMHALVLTLQMATAVMPCHLPIAIGKDGKLLEPCDATTGKPLSGSPMGGRASSIAVAESRREPSTKPEAPVVCPSDALGPVTAKWNKVSVDWYRASQAYQPDEHLPWLFQCRGDLVERASADASKDPSAARDIMAWLLTWLFDHGVVAHEVSAWHHFTTVRPAGAEGATEVFVASDDGHFAGPGEIDREGMSGESWLDPDCTDKCVVWYWAPMVPYTATVVSWGKQ